MNIKTITVLAATWLALLLIAVGLLVAASGAQACEEVYFKVGAGYKQWEQDHWVSEGEKFYTEDNQKVSARFELGVQNGKWTVGISHHSQWGEGWPINNEFEYYKTEFFVDRKFSLWGL